MDLLTKPFRECTLAFLDRTFALDQVLTHPVIDHWLNVPVELTDFEQQQLAHLQHILTLNVHDWNEYELDTHFIGPLFTLVNFTDERKRFNHFGQRELEGVVNGYLLFGKPDGMVASGRREPETPYFAFQEYKRELDPNGDPAGQCLAAMLVGQSFDLPAVPMYGCYVVGAVWRFMILVEQQYAISLDFSATSSDELLAIFRALKSLKQIVTERTA
jgi:hypothetical protein